MSDIIRVTEDDQYSETYPMGMREMQYKAYARKNSQYILIKAPPAAGKSRALMYLALDKLNTQGISKIIISVPERSIGGSFKSTILSDKGFPWDWKLNDKYNLCENKSNKGNILTQFLDDDKENILICPHATFRETIKGINIEKFDNCLIAIDEFHHATTDINKKNVLGSVLEKLMDRNKIHLIGMTGSYIRGDGNDILNPAYENKFDIVEYTFYEQLCSFKYLKGVSYDYRFYSDSNYVNSIKENLNLNKKTIIYLPNANSIPGKEKDKNEAVREIYSHIGEEIFSDPVNGIDFIRTKEGQTLKVCNFVNDNPKDRAKYLKYTSDLSDKDSLDIIIALNMAKEGFDWPWCEEVIVTNYRGSPTEVIQIFGRVSRDCPGKEEGRFIYLIPRPDLGNNELANETNNLLKAITISLLMKNIAAKKYYFVNEENVKTTNGELKFTERDGVYGKRSTIVVKEEEGCTQRAIDILNDYQENIIEQVTIQCPSVKELILNSGNPRLLIDIEIPDMISNMFEDVDDLEAKYIAKTIYYSMSQIYKGPDDVEFKEAPQHVSSFGKQSFKYLSVDDYYINTIKEKNMLEGEFQILSKSINAELLLEMSNHIKSKELTDAEVIRHIKDVVQFKEDYKKMPNPNSKDKYERRLGLIGIRLTELMYKRKLEKENN